MPRVILVATHADTSQTLRDQSGHYVSEQANSVCVTLRQHYATTFHINRRVVVVDSHQALSPGIRLLKSLVQTERTSIAQVFKDLQCSMQYRFNYSFSIVKCLHGMECKVIEGQKLNLWLPLNWGHLLIALYRSELFVLVC